MILVFGVGFTLASPYFLTRPNLVDLVEACSMTTIPAAGVFVVLVPDACRTMMLSLSEKGRDGRC